MRTLFFVLLNPHSLHLCCVTSGPIKVSLIALSVAGATHHSCPTLSISGCMGASGTLTSCTVQSPICGSRVGGLIASSFQLSTWYPTPAPVGNPSTFFSEVAPPVSGPCLSSWHWHTFFFDTRLGLTIFTESLSVCFFMFTVAGSIIWSGWVVSSTTSILSHSLLSFFSLTTGF